jgi:hypothetical protein
MVMVDMEIDLAPVHIAHLLSSNSHIQAVLSMEEHRDVCQLSQRKHGNSFGVQMVAE